MMMEERRELYSSGGEVLDGSIVCLLDCVDI